MTILFAGSELEALQGNAGGSGYDESNIKVETSYARRGSKPGTQTNTSFLLAEVPVEQDDFWLGFSAWITASSNSNRTILTLFDENGDGVVRLFQVSSNSGFAYLQIYTGGEWVTQGDAFNTSDDHFFNLHVQIGSPSQVALYIDEVSGPANITAALGAVTGIKSVRFYGTTANTTFSQVTISDTPNLDFRLHTVVPNSLGSDTDGVGTVADINETPLNNTTFIAFDSADDRSSFKAAARTISREVKGFTVTGRLRYTDEAGLKHARPYVKIESTRYYGTTFALDLGYKNYQYTWVLNPATTAAWLASEVNDANLEWGWEVVTG